MKLISWEVFVRAKPGRDFIHVGNLRAKDAKEAIKAGLETFTESQKGLTIWAVPSDQVTANDPDNSDALFTSAENKTYRHATDYPLPEGIEHM